MSTTSHRFKALHKEFVSASKTPLSSYRAAEITVQENLFLDLITKLVN